MDYKQYAENGYRLFFDHLRANYSAHSVNMESHAKSNNKYHLFRLFDKTTDIRSNREFHIGAQGNDLLSVGTRQRGNETEWEDICLLFSRF